MDAGAQYDALGAEEEVADDADSLTKGEVEEIINVADLVSARNVIHKPGRRQISPRSG